MQIFTFRNETVLCCMSLITLRHVTELLFFLSSCHYNKVQLNKNLHIYLEVVSSMTVTAKNNELGLVTCVV